MGFLWHSCVIPMGSYGTLMRFLLFSYWFPMVFRWRSSGFPLCVFLWTSDGLPTVSQWFSTVFSMGPIVCSFSSYGFPLFFRSFCCGVLIVFPLFLHCVPKDFRWFSKGFPLVFALMFFCFPVVFLWFSRVFRRFSYGIRIVFCWSSDCFPVAVSWLSH